MFRLRSRKHIVREPLDIERLNKIFTHLLLAYGKSQKTILVVVNIQKVPKKRAMGSNLEIFKINTSRAVMVLKVFINLTFCGFNFFAIFTRFKWSNFFLLSYYVSFLADKVSRLFSKYQNQAEIPFLWHHTSKISTKFWVWPLPDILKKLNRIHFKKLT